MRAMDYERFGCRLADRVQERGGPLPLLACRVKAAATLASPRRVRWCPTLTARSDSVVGNQRRSCWTGLHPARAARRRQWLWEYRCGRCRLRCQCGSSIGSKCSVRCCRTHDCDHNPDVPWGIFGGGEEQFQAEEADFATLSGSIHRRPSRRAKSPSVEHRMSPYSTASAARWASGTRLARPLPRSS